MKRLYLILSILLIPALVYAYTVGTSPNMVPANWMAYAVDPGATDSGVTSTSQVTLKNLVTDIGTTKKATIIFPHTGSGTTTQYTIGTALDLSSYSNITFQIENGAQLRVSDGVSGVTLPSPSNVRAYPNQQIVSGTSLYFSQGGIFHVGWWGGIQDDNTTDNTAIINRILYAVPKKGATIRIPEGIAFYMENVDFDTAGCDVVQLEYFGGSDKTADGTTINTHEPIKFIQAANSSGINADYRFESAHHPGLILNVRKGLTNIHGLGSSQNLNNPVRGSINIQDEGYAVGSYQYIGYPTKDGASGIKIGYLGYFVTLPGITVASFATSPSVNDTIVGITSGATGFFLDFSGTGSTMRVLRFGGKFENGETIKDTDETTTDTITSSPTYVATWMPGSLYVDRDTGYAAFGLNDAPQPVSVAGRVGMQSTITASDLYTPSTISYPGLVFADYLNGHGRLTLKGIVTGDFVSAPVAGETITGITSGTTGTFIDFLGENSSMRVSWTSISGVSQFVVSETVSDANETTTSTIKEVIKNQRMILFDPISETYRTRRLLMYDHSGVTPIANIGAVRAHGNITTSGPTKSTTSFNIASGTSNGLGDVSVTFTTPFVTNDYSCTVSTQNPDVLGYVYVKTTSAVRFRFRQVNPDSVSGATDPAIFNFICVGGDW